MNTSKKLYWQFAGSLFLVGFVILGYLIKFYPATIEPLDSFFNAVFRGNLTPDKTRFFQWLTKFGNVATIGFLIALFLLFFWRNKKNLEALWLFVNGALVAGLGNFLIKFVFDRPRPNVAHLVPVSHSSFPSGHAMGSLLFYGTFLFLLSTFTDSMKLQRVGQLVLSLFILAIGISRIYLGVHYPTDVLGGFLLAGAWLCFSYPVFRQQQFIQQFKQGKGS